MTEDEEYVPEPDHEYLFTLANKIYRLAPIHIDTDGGDVDRLREIAGKLRDAQPVSCVGDECVYSTSNPGGAGWHRNEDGWRCGWCSCSTD